MKYLVLVFALMIPSSVFGGHCFQPVRRVQQVQVQKFVAPTTRVIQRQTIVVPTRQLRFRQSVRTFREVPGLAVRQQFSVDQFGNVRDGFGRLRQDIAVDQFGRVQRVRGFQNFGGNDVIVRNRGVQRSNFRRNAGSVVGEVFRGLTNLAVTRALLRQPQILIVR